MVAGIGFFDREALVFPVGQGASRGSTVRRVNAPWHRSGASPVPRTGASCVSFDSPRTGDPDEDRSLHVRALRVARRSTHESIRARRRVLVDVGGATGWQFHQHV